MSYSQHYLVRSCDFVRLQVFYLALFNLVIVMSMLLIFGGDYLWWAAVAVANSIIVSVQGWWIFPYTWCAAHEVKSAQSNAQHSIRIMSANVLMSNHNSDALLKLVDKYQPDLLITLESDDWWQQKLSVLKKDYPYTIDCPKDNRYGMHLFSKYKIKQAQICELVESDVPSIHILFVNDEGLEIQGHFIHPAPPSPTEEDSSRPRDSELIMVAKALKDATRPVIVAGDLNDVAWSRSTRLFMQVSGLLDPRKGRGFFNTFHASYFFMRWPLDHLFHSTGFTVKRIKRLAKYGSDHFALLTELVYEDIEQHSNLDENTELEEDVDALMMEHLDKGQVPTF
ncbi:endonuclease/exonuclease/phosphatase family protein [Pseudoalteromonas sp. NEC-BIFX-2020_002]|nr:endonuclease/exonuclease/phosphatase family protein [Pseudoalteromonas sp. NEC-BIFX-2020_002]NNG43463.1 endonuclease/exonuclease/phosphatase family protein [Pseudoalteromonas sp. NEC-BIFX-2020_002]